MTSDHGVGAYAITNASVMQEQWNTDILAEQWELEDVVGREHRERKYVHLLLRAKGMFM